MVFVLLGSCCITEQMNEVLFLGCCPVLFGFTAEGVVHLSHLGSSVAAPSLGRAGGSWAEKVFQRGFSREGFPAEPVSILLLPASTSP